MKKSLALIGVPESRFVEKIAARLGDDRFSCHILSLDAPFEGTPVTATAGALAWEGTDLLECEMVFLERSVFSWPQIRLQAGGERTDLAPAQWSVFQREALALVHSSLLIAADRVRVVNPPAAAHLAASPSIALESLAGKGVSVHPWRVGPAPPRGSAGKGIVLDLCGRERRHIPRRPEEGGHALLLEPLQGGVVEVLVTGERCAGAIRFPNAEYWAGLHDAGEGGEHVQPEPVADLESIADAVDLAKRSALALGLDFAAVSVGVESKRPSVLLCEASPDLASWDEMLNGAASTAVADSLVSIVSAD